MRLAAELARVQTRIFLHTETPIVLMPSRIRLAGSAAVCLYRRSRRCVTSITVLRTFIQLEASLHLESAGSCTWPCVTGRPWSINIARLKDACLLTIAQFENASPFLLFLVRDRL